MARWSSRASRRCQARSASAGAGTPRRARRSTSSLTSVRTRTRTCGSPGRRDGHGYQLDVHVDAWRREEPADHPGLRGRSAAFTGHEGGRRRSPCGASAGFLRPSNSQRCKRSSTTAHFAVSTSKSCMATEWRHGEHGQGSPLGPPRTGLPFPVTIKRPDGSKSVINGIDPKTGKFNGPRIRLIWGRPNLVVTLTNGAEYEIPLERKKVARGDGRWYVEYTVPAEEGGGTIRFRLNRSAEDALGKKSDHFNRAEHLRAVRWMTLTGRSTGAATTPSRATVSSTTRSLGSERTASGPSASGLRCSRGSCSRTPGHSSCTGAGTAHARRTLRSPPDSPASHPAKDEARPRSASPAFRVGFDRLSLDLPG